MEIANFPVSVMLQMEPQSLTSAMTQEIWAIDHFLPQLMMGPVSISFKFFFFFYNYHHQSLVPCMVGLLQEFYLSIPIYLEPNSPISHTSNLF